LLGCSFTAPIPESRNAKSAQRSWLPKSSPSQISLQANIDAWETLPGAVKVGILATVKAAGGITGQDR
jgi:hypothetical protein